MMLHRMALPLSARGVALATALSLALAPLWQRAAAQGDSAIVARARAIHAKVIKLDTHVDFEPRAMTDTTPNYVTGQASQVDLPKMRNGGMNGVFFSIYVGQAQDFSDSAYARAHAVDVAKFEAVHRLAEKLAPNEIEIATTAADVRRIHAKGKLIALMGVENGYGIGTDVTNVRKFYDYGARYLSLAHNGHNQLSDSNNGEANNEWRWNGVSPLGKQVVAEANRLGIMLDISHPSKESNLWVMANSRAPVIASHSSARALCRTASRDLDDEQLLALKKNGGVMQTVAFSGYVKCASPPSPERVAALAALAQEFGLPANVVGRGKRIAALDSAKLAAYQAKLDALNAKFPPPAPVRANVRDLVDHIDYAVKLIGIDHVGISSDFDGGGGIDGYTCTSEAINVTIELVRRGYTEKQIEQLWGGNVLRVMEQVEKVAKQIQGTRS